MFTGNMVYKCLKLQLLINIRATCLLLEFEFIMFTFTFLCAQRIFFYMYYRLQYSISYQLLYTHVSASLKFSFENIGGSGSVNVQIVYWVPYYYSS